MKDEMVRVAIVDDSQSMLTYMVNLVSTEFEEGVAKAFIDPNDALDWCSQNDVDLVIVDYVMPKVNGLEFIEKFRQENQHADIPIIMVTNSKAKEIRYRALQLGATDFLAKPVDRCEFLRRIRNLLTLSRHHKETRHYAAGLADEVAKATQDVLTRERETVLVLSRAAEYRDNETGAHLVRMANYSRIIAERLGLSPDEVATIFTAAPMHDIGKIGIPDNILLKPGPFTPEERAIMATHAEIGWQILHNQQSSLLRVAADIALSHHERWDGGGYPNRLVGEAIPLVGRITAVADVFDALTSHRPYKEPWPVGAALTWMREARGTHFDPACVDAFLASLDEVMGVARLYGLEQNAGRANR